MIFGGMKRIAASVISLALVSGCAPELTLKGQKTTVGHPEQIKSCRHLGNTKISLDTAGIKILDKEEVHEHLQIEARNFAGRIGADTVLPVGEMKEGSRLFKLYMCDTGGQN